MGEQFLFCSICGITEEEEVRPQIIVVPVPVPVFVPVPLHLYTQYTPVPLGMPVPVSCSQLTREVVYSLVSEQDTEQCPWAS